jgi:hypothetical protein
MEELRYQIGKAFSGSGVTMLTLLLVVVALIAWQQAPVQAADEAEVTCAMWADTKPWSITRCEDAFSGEICFVASSGMMACRFDY